jgi:phospholipid/cholesterol/gamma-HCH transport system permease protein
MYPRLHRAATTVAGGWTRIGLQTRFYVATLRCVPQVWAFYKIELVRLIAQMSLGTGALIVRVEALTGFASAYLTVR